MGSQDHQTLVAAVKAAGLVETLKGPGPFTLFAPTDAAFAKLPAGTVDTLLQPANRDQLRSVLTYHVVSGKVTSKELVRLIRASGGEATFKTVQGAALTARLAGNSVAISDANGGTAMVTKADLASSNGVIHVTDAVSLPSKTASAPAAHLAFSAAGLPFKAIGVARMYIVNKVTLLLLVVGGFNWGLIGLFGFDLVAALFGEMTMLSRAVYTLVGVSAVWQLVSLFTGEKEQRPGIVRA